MGFCASLLSPVSLRHFGGNISIQLLKWYEIYWRKELINLSETGPWSPGEKLWLLT
jgi:hypothetical protein